jgi:hypothetical protein
MLESERKGFKFEATFAHSLAAPGSKNEEAARP